MKEIRAGKGKVLLDALLEIAAGRSDNGRTITGAAAQAIARRALTEAGHPKWCGENVAGRSK